LVSYSSLSHLAGPSINEAAGAQVIHKPVTVTVSSNQHES